MDLLFVILQNVIKYYSYALIIFILMSWLPNARETSIGTFLARICEPYLEQFRKIIPPLGMIDISPIVALFVLQLANGGLYQLYRWIA
ncbi:YggT family protein [Niallia nealsonii]|uniref:YggT family protein n=1 Tax=Niallia nealsonii TaxID=115979 RepID=A0A2N0YXZ2_9BACI|nr:YggT family protein [Niallia nealsonii]PKG22115.1 hypothetical protein CWS01_18385 [Niallia nealsonii]